MITAHGVQLTCAVKVRATSILRAGAKCCAHCGHHCSPAPIDTSAGPGGCSFECTMVKCVNSFTTVLCRVSATHTRWNKEDFVPTSNLVASSTTNSLDIILLAHTSSMPYRELATNVQIAPKLWFTDDLECHTSVAFTIGSTSTIGS